MKKLTPIITLFTLLSSVTLHPMKRAGELLEPANSKKVHWDISQKDHDCMETKQMKDAVPITETYQFDPYEEAAIHILAHLSKDHVPVTTNTALSNTTKQPENPMITNPMITPIKPHTIDKILIYVCKLCNKAFAQKNTLDRHMQIHNKCVCSLCDKTFMHKRSLNRHIKQKHT